MFVYVLQNELGNIYIGQTNDMKDRLRRHRSGQCKASSKHPTSWEVLHKWDVPDREKALKLESWLHHLTTGKVMEVILDCPYYSPWLEKEASIKVKGPIMMSRFK